jgi:hypothetical protein
MATYPSQRSLILNNKSPSENVESPMITRGIEDTFDQAAVNGSCHKSLNQYIRINRSPNLLLKKNH